MTVLSLPASKPNPVSNWFSRRWSAVKTSVARVKAPASFQNAVKMPFIVLGVGLVAAGVMLVSLAAGLVVLGVALIGLEFLVALMD